MKRLLLAGLMLGALTLTGCSKGSEEKIASSKDQPPGKVAPRDEVAKGDGAGKELPVTQPKVQPPVDTAKGDRDKEESKPKVKQPKEPPQEQLSIAELIAAAKELKTGAVDALAAAGPKAIPAIIGELRRDDRRFSWATAAMAKMGPEAVQPVASLLNDNDHFMRKVAYMTLGQMGPTAMPAVPALQRAVQQDRDARNKGLAASAISQITRR